jgi:hypothetical protein
MNTCRFVAEDIEEVAARPKNDASVLTVNSSHVGNYCNIIDKCI